MNAYEIAVNLRNEGKTYNAIANNLNNQGVKTPTGKRWTAGNINLLIKGKRNHTLRSASLTVTPSYNPYSGIKSIIGLTGIPAEKKLRAIQELIS